MSVMTNDDVARLVYLLLLLVLVGAAVFSYRNRLSVAAKHALIWVALFVVILVGYTYRTTLLSFAGPVLSELNPGRPFEVTDADGVRSLVLSRADNGHFTLIGRVNKFEVNFLVDTGATSTVLTFRDAERVGLEPAKLRFDRQVQTANGIAREAVVRVDRLEIGHFVLRDHRIGIAEAGNLPVNLLGLDVLNRFERWNVEGDRLILTPDL